MKNIGRTLTLLGTLALTDGSEPVNNASQANLKPATASILDSTRNKVVINEDPENPDALIDLLRANHPAELTPENEGLIREVIAIAGAGFLDLYNQLGISGILLLAALLVCLRKGFNGNISLPPQVSGELTSNFNAAAELTRELDTSSKGELPPERAEEMFARAGVIAASIAAILLPLGAALGPSVAHAGLDDIISGGKAAGEGLTEAVGTLLDLLGVAAKTLGHAAIAADLVIIVFAVLGGVKSADDFVKVWRKMRGFGKEGVVDKLYQAANPLSARTGDMPGAAVARDAGSALQAALRNRSPGEMKSAEARISDGETNLGPLKRLAKEQLDLAQQIQAILGVGPAAEFPQEELDYLVARFRGNTERIPTLSRSLSHEARKLGWSNIASISLYLFFLTLGTSWVYAHGKVLLAKSGTPAAPTAPAASGGPGAPSQADAEAERNRRNIEAILQEGGATPPQPQIEQPLPTEPGIVVPPSGTLPIPITPPAPVAPAPQAPKQEPVKVRKSARDIK